MILNAPYPHVPHYGVSPCPAFKKVQLEFNFEEVSKCVSDEDEEFAGAEDGVSDAENG